MLLKYINKFKIKISFLVYLMYESNFIIRTHCIRLAPKKLILHFNPGLNYYYMIILFYNRCSRFYLE